MKYIVVGGIFAVILYAAVSLNMDERDEQNKAVSKG